MEALPHPVFAATRDGACDFVNAKLVAYTGQAASSLHGAGWIEAIHPDDQARIVEAWRGRTRHDACDVHSECRLRRHDGEFRWFDVHLVASRDESGAIVRWVGSCIDVHEARETVAALERERDRLKRADEEIRTKQRLESIGQLAGGIAHDFNNLLTIIVSCTDEVLSVMSAGDPSREPLLETRLAVERATSLTRDLLAFSRRQVNEPKVLDLNDVVADATRMLRRLLGEDVALGTDLSSAIPSVRIDPSQWTSVLINLAVNARHAMPRGGRLDITTTPDSGGVLLEVKDTGEGMPREVVSRIFEPFFTTKGVGKGTGLGLAVVRGTVEQSQGRIEVSSTPGVGTRFRIWLPAFGEPKPAHGAERGADVTTMDEERASGVTKRPTILFVEDDAIVRRAAVRNLEGRGFVVLPSANAEEALHALKARGDDIDVLITDVVLPKMDGRTLVEKMSARYPHIAVLYTSGYTDDDVLRYGISSAEVSFLQKPYTIRHLVKRVRELIEARASGSKDHAFGG